MNLYLISLQRTTLSSVLLQQEQNTFILKKLGDLDKVQYLEADSEELSQKLEKTALRFSITMLGNLVIILVAVTTLLNL